MLLSPEYSASFLAQPNAINEPLFKTLSTCFDAMRKDPNAVNNVLAIMGRELEAANDKYSKMTPQERGVQDGKAMFWFINPAGSTEAADLALVRLEPVIAPVDAALVQTIERSVQAIKEMAKTSLEAAQQTKQMLLDYINGEGLYGRKLAGIPDGFFDGMKPTEPIKTSDTMNAMSKADDLGGASKPSEAQLNSSDLAYRGDHDVHSRFNTKGRPKSFINEKGDLSPADPLGLYKGQKVTVEEHLAARWCKGAKAHSPYISFGEKDGVLKTFGQGNGLTLDLKALRQAISSGEVVGLRLYEHEEVLNAVQHSRFHVSIRNKLLTWAKAHKEVVVEGIIPQRFLELGLK